LATVEIIEKIEILREKSSLAGLLPGWALLATAAAVSPTQDANWSLACAESVDAGLALFVVVIGGIEHPRAVAPLVRRGSQLELLGAEMLHEPTELLAEDEEALRELAKGIASLRTPVLLHRLPADSPSIRALKQAFRPFGFVVARDSYGHGAIALDEEWTKPEGKLSKRRASDMRRARRRAEADGEVETEILAPQPQEVDELVDEAYAIEARSWKGAEGTALAMDADRGDFYRRYCHSAAEQGALRVAFLKIGGRRVAMEIAVEWDSKLWLLKIGHDDQFKRCSPGMLLLLEVVRNAAAEGLVAVQLWGGVDSWTSMWTDDVEECATVAAYPPGPGSLSAALSHIGTAANSRREGRRRN
jgi:CelD/BcsL family acetyltransferase involved in cellulose biosynthesis